MKASISVVVASVIVALACSGCVSTNHAVIKEHGDFVMAKVQVESRGIILGMCGPMTHAYETDRFMLHGTKSKYSISEIVALNERLKQVDLRYDEGWIRIDKSAGVVEIALKSHGIPCEMNGRYRIDGKVVDYLDDRL